MRKTRILFSLLLFVTAREASAQVARHEDVEIKPITENGHAVGFKLRLTLRPQGYTGPQGVAQVGIGIADTAWNSRSDGDRRMAASDPARGYLRHAFPLERNFTANEARAVEYTVRYGEGNTPHAG